jgi:tetratricopeptide (TPR) repeat protein
MTYAHLQLAQDLEAKRVLDVVTAMRKVDAILGNAYALAAIPARYALERRQWAEATSLTPYPSDFAWNRFPMAEAVTFFVRGLGAARSGNADSARKDMNRLQSLHEALLKAKQAYWAEQVEIQRQVVAAWIARAEEKNQEALKLMRAAADLEDKTEKHIVTPGPIVPARELLGEMLIDLENPGQALKEFEASHRVEPNRFRGLYGAAKAAELLGDREKAKTYYAKLVALCERADTERPELQEAKAFLAKK